VRRFYPFAPFLGGRAVTDLEWRGEPIPSGALVLLDLYGQNHDPALWKNPYRFDPERFLGPDAEAAPNTVALLSDLAVRVARLDYDVPPQDLDIPLDRIPARPRDGMVVVPLRGCA